MQYVKNHLKGLQGDNDSAFDQSSGNPTSDFLGTLVPLSFQSANPGSSHGKDGTGTSDGSAFDQSSGNPTSDLLGTQVPLSFQSVSPASNHGNGDTGTSGGTSLSTSYSTAATFHINVVWDASVASAPAGFTAGVLAAAQRLESQFADPVTINIAVGYGEVGGQSLGGNRLGSSGAYSQTVGYSSLVSSLAADAKTSVDTSVVASLPGTSPVNGTFYVSNPQAKALGLMPANGTSIDGFAGFSSSLPFSYDNTNGVASGTYDFIGTVMHEMSHLMGRTMAFGATSSSNYMLYDLLHYSAAGVRDLSAYTPGYFSTDGGVTDQGDFNTNPGADAEDWGPAMGNDSFNAFAACGVVNALSASDLTVLNALGWDPVGSVVPPPPPAPPAPPSGISIAAISSSLAVTGFQANAALAKITQVGGPAGDTYSYTLGGAGAGSFAISTTNGVGTLSVGSGSIPGVTNGAAYSLTVTANDLTSGLSSPAMPLDVVVATTGADTVSVAALVGSLSTGLPTFIYGRGGHDTLNGSGMTGKLWFDGGAGTDVLTGGSGINSFLYPTVDRSAPSAPDTITNFHTADTIDLAGLGAALKYAGELPSTAGHGKKVSDQVLPAHSIGWQQSGGNTSVYVNTSGSSESLSGSNMRITLLGTPSLTDANFLHG